MKTFITFEGGEGTGKTTQSRALAQAFEAAGIACTPTREPGGSKGAEAIRALLVQGETERWDAKTEVLLHFAARRDHIRHTIAPALAAGAFVLCDRFMDSTIAYQHYGHGIDKAVIDFLGRHIVEDILPALTFIFTLPEAEGMKRASTRGGKENRYEKMGEAFHQKVAAGFLEIARNNPSRCVVVDASQPIAAIHREVVQEVNRRFHLSLPLQEKY